MDWESKHLKKNLVDKETSKPIDYDLSLTHLQTISIHEYMIEKESYWKDTKPDNDEVSMNEHATDQMLDLQEMKSKFKKVYRQTYLGVSKQAERRCLKSQNSIQSSPGLTWMGTESN